MVGDFDVIIAGTEQISDKVMAAGRNLKHLSRVGIGLDSLDLMATERRGVLVSYTGDNFPANSACLPQTARLLVIPRSRKSSLPARVSQNPVNYPP